MREENEILILCNTNVFPTRYFWERGVDFFKYYDDALPIPLKILRRATLKIRSIRTNLWYGKWYKNFGKYKKVILFSINGISDILQDIEKIKLPKQQILIFFWDPVFRTEDCLNSSFDKWSFDRKDCEKFNLNFNSTFYFRNIYEEFISNNKGNIVSSDVYFVGLEKGRNDLLRKIQTDFTVMNVSTNFVLIEEGAYKKRRVTFLQNLNFISTSRAILDIVQDNQTGLTVRVMESIFFKKKLITNNPLVKNESFYNPNNVFILGVDQMNQVKSFLDKPYDDSNSNVQIEYFDFKNWLSRFDA